MIMTTITMITDTLTRLNEPAGFIAGLLFVNHVIMPLGLSMPSLRHTLWLLLPIGSTALSHTAELDTVVVSSASQQSLYDVAQPVTVMSKEEIDANSGSTLGTLLENTPGIANAAFGAGVGRPVIRGMSGSRVKILQNGSDSADVSAMSSDHSPMAEATSAEQIEIIYGPATLLYGGGAIGGVVNLVDRRIHEQPSQGIHGDIGAKYSSVDRGHNVDALLDVGQGNWVLHLDGFKRDADNYESGNPDAAPRRHNRGRIENSNSQGQGGAIALSWADGESGFFGASISTLEYDYGVPNLDGDQFRVTPKQTRYDVKGAWRPSADSAFNWIEEWRTELSYNDYQHAETEPGLSIGLFEQQSSELQSRIRHQMLGRWQGSVGIQLKHQKLALCHDHSGCDGIPSFGDTLSDDMGTDLASREQEGFYLAHSTPMPTTTTVKAGLFIVEQRDWQHGTIELGARIDQVRIEANPDPIAIDYRQGKAYYQDKTFTPTTLSAAATWVLSEQQRFGLNIARVQRAPEASELYWNGDHHATFSFQLDNPNLTEETAYTIDLNWLYQGAQNSIRIATYFYQFDDYIYNDLKDFADRFHGNEVYRYEQADARFYGAEFSWQHNLTDAWHIDVNADIVRAELVDGGYLPRTPPASLLLALNWERNGWDARLETRAVAEQTETAANERSTDGYIIVNAILGYRHAVAHGDVQWQLAVRNLSDEYTLNHVSYLKQAAPMPGRSIQLSTRWRF